MKQYQTYTRKVQTFDIYLPIDIKKFYNDGVSKEGVIIMAYKPRKLTNRFGINMNPKYFLFGDKIPLFSDFMFKGIFEREEHKDYLSFFLQCVLNKEIRKEKLNFYKNEIGIDETIKTSFRCDLAVFYENTLYIIECNSSSKLKYQIRNLIYTENMLYQFLLSDKKINVVLININNYSNKNTNQIIENYSINDGILNLYTKNIKIYEIYLTKVLEKYYTLECKSQMLYLKYNVIYQPTEEEKLTEFEKMLVAGCLVDTDEALRLVEGSDILMNMMQDNFVLSYDNGTGKYYQSFIDVQRESLEEGEKRGEKTGREKAYMEIAKVFGIPYEVIKERIKNKKK